MDFPTTTLGLLAGVLAWWVAAPLKRIPSSDASNPRDRRRWGAREGRWGVWWRDLEPIGRGLGSHVPAGLADRLVRAGSPAGLSAPEWAALVRGATAICFGGAALVGLLVAGGVLPLGSLVCVPIALALPGLPNIVVDSVGNLRLRTLEARLPDLMGRVSVALRAGLPVRLAWADAVAIELLSGRTPPWLQRELMLSARLMELSCFDLMTSLGRLHRSIPSDDLVLLMSQLAVGQESGAPIADTLRGFARERRTAFATVRQARVGSAVMVATFGGALPGATLTVILILYALDVVIQSASTPLSP